MASAFDTLSETLAGFGLTLSERTALAFGAPVLKALSEIGTGGKVFVACKDGASILTLAPKLSEEASKVARFIDATDVDYSKVRPHVVNYAKGRKIPVTTNTIKNADSEIIGFTVSKRSK